MSNQDSTFSAANFISPPILLIYIALGCCVVKRLFVQKPLDPQFFSLRVAFYLV